MRRRWLVVGFLIALAGVVAWRLGEMALPTPTLSSMPMTVPASAAVRPPALPRSPLAPPAIQLAKAVAVRSVQVGAAGALEGTVVDADTDEGIVGAELTFSHDDGAYSTTTSVGGAFRFAPRGAGMYRLISIEAKGYAPFEGEFDRSPVSFASVPGRDMAGVVMRLSPASVHFRHDEKPDAGIATMPATGSLRGRVFDAGTGASVVAFAIALWRRQGIAVPTMVASASFIDPSGSYQIDGLSPGIYEASALAAGYAWSSYLVREVGDSSVDADFALHAGARITGVVTDGATRLPIAGAELSLEGRRGDAPDLPAAPLSPEATTDSDGRFTLGHVPPDALGLRVEKRGYLHRLVALGPLPEDGDAPPFTIELNPRHGEGAHFELTGIGAVLRARADAIEIRQLLPGGGAAEAGLVPGDEIIAIDGAPVTALGFEGAMGAIRGPEGTWVTLRIRRAGREVDVIVSRKLVRG